MNYTDERPPREAFGARASGRSTTMVRRALAQALTGVTVYVIAASGQECKRLMNLLIYQPEMQKLANVHVSYLSGDIQLPSGQLRFRSMENDQWDWRTKHVKGMPHGIPIHIDHFAWESMAEQRDRSKK